MPLSERIPCGPTLLAVLALMIAPAILLGPCLFGARTYVPFDLASFPPVSTMLTPAERAQLDETPPNFDVTELPVLVLPELRLAHQELAAGRLPEWNPYARFGAPLYANGLAAMAYPVDTLLLLLGDPQGGLAFGAWIGFSIAGVLAFALCRAVGGSVPAALLAGLAFGIGGTLTTNGHFYMRMNALCWLPGTLLACLRLSERRGLARAPALVGLAVCTASTLLAGFPPFAVASLLVAGLWCLPLLWRTARRDGSRALSSLAAWLALGVGLGAALAAVQVAPMFAFFPESNRDVVPSLAVTVSQAFDPMGLLGYVLPTAFGEPGGAPAYDHSPLAYLLWTRRAFDVPRLQFPHDYNFVEYAVFAGTLPLLLAALGIAAARDRVVRWAAVLLAALFVVAAAPLWLAPFYRLPVVASVPPMRYVGPAAVLVALLAGAGLDALLKGTTPRRTTAVGVAGLVLAALCLGLGLASPLGDVDGVIASLARRYDVPAQVVREIFAPADFTAGAARLDAALFHASWVLLVAGAWILAAARFGRRPRARAALLTLALVGTAVELLAFAAPRNAGRVLRHDPVDTPVHRFLLERNRDLAGDGGLVLARAAHAVKEPVDLPPGALFPLRLRDLQSYAFVDAWSYRPFLELYGSGQMIRRFWPRAFPDDERLELPFFDLVGLRYLVSTDELKHAGARVGPALEGPTGERFFVYERPHPLPRAFVVHALRELPDDDAVVRALIAPDLDPRAAALVTQEAAETLGRSPAAPAAAPRLVRFVRDLPGDLLLEVAGGPAGYLMVCDAPLRGWSVTVDGRPTQSVRGDLFMRAIPVPAGACQVALTYRTPGLWAGALVSWIAALGLAALSIAFVRSRRTIRRSDEPRSPAAIENA